MNLEMCTSLGNIIQSWINLQLHEAEAIGCHDTCCLTGLFSSNVISAPVCSNFECWYLSWLSWMTPTESGNTKDGNKLLAIRIEGTYWGLTYTYIISCFLYFWWSNQSRWINRTGPSSHWPDVDFFCVEAYSLAFISRYLFIEIRLCLID